MTEEIHLKCWIHTSFLSSDEFLVFLLPVLLVLLILAFLVLVQTRLLGLDYCSGTEGIFASVRRADHVGAKNRHIYKFLRLNSSRVQCDMYILQISSSLEWW